MANIEFPTDRTDLNEDKPIASAFDIVFTIIAVLASGFSGYTTFLGFSYDLPLIPSLIIAIIIGLGLLIINFKLREYRIEGDSISMPIIAFFVFFIFSFISNTNAIYTYFIQNDIVPDTQINAWRDFDKGTSILLSAIDDNTISLEGSRRKATLDIARQNLKEQITDRANPGLGAKARIHLQEIETILGVSLTRLKPPSGPGPFSRYNDYANRLDELIMAQFDSKYKTTRSRKVSDLRDKIIKLRKLYEDSVNKKQYSPDTTDFMRRDLDSLKIEAQNVINFSDSVPVINVSADDIGSFQYTWTNFYNKIKLPAIILSILLSIMLDTLTPVLSLLLYKQEVEY
jgi:hypothetical protein